jgi:hypothetical protein
MYPHQQKSDDVRSGLPGENKQITSSNPVAKIWHLKLSELLCRNVMDLDLVEQ